MVNGPPALRAQVLLEVVHGVIKSTWNEDMGGAETLRVALEALPLQQVLPDESQAASLLAYLELLCGAVKRRLADDTVVQGPSKARTADAMEWEPPSEASVQPSGLGPSVRVSCSLSPVRPSSPSERVDAVSSAVLQNADLLELIFSCLLPSGHGRRDVRTLSPLSAVCRKWREVSRYELWWACISSSVFPPEWRDQEPRLSADHDHVSFLAQGRRLMRERRVWNGEDWREGLSVHFELADRRDWKMLLSVTGQLALSRAPGTNAVTLRFLGDALDEGYCEAPVFSAASRDPEGQYQWNSMLDLFSAPDVWAAAGQAQEGGLATLYARVSLRDHKTGRTALLWEQGRAEGSVFMRVTDEPSALEWFADALTDRAFRVRGHPSSLIAPTWPQGVAPPWCTVDFYVDSVEEEMEGVSGRDQLWEVVALGGEDESERSSVNLTLHGVEDTAVVARWVRSLLE